MRKSVRGLLAVTVALAMVLGMAGGALASTLTPISNPLTATIVVQLASEVWVATTGDDTTGDGSQAKPFRTIQKGISEVLAGGTVHVAAGTYDEQVVINKRLTLEGAGDTTVVQPSSAAKLTQVFDGLFWYGGTKNIAGIIVANVSDGAPVTIKNLKVVASGVATKPTGADYLAGVFYRETGGTVDTVSVVGTGPWSGGDRAYGMYLSAGTNPVSVEVKGSTITAFDKNGIEAMGSRLTADIHHNTVTGRGSVSDEVQNGVNVGRDAVVTVNNNTIKDLAYQPQTWWAAGILVYHYVSPTGKSATANNNSITNCQIGIIFNNANGSAQANTVAGGTVGLVGLWAEYDAGTWTASFIGNTVTAASDAGTSQNAAIGVEGWQTGAAITATIDANVLVSSATTRADGIYIGGSAGSIVATITNNTISKWERGIVREGAVAATVTATRNKIYSNTDYGITSTTAVAATHNWWGHGSGPGAVALGSGDKVSANVTYDPWWTNVEMTTLVASDGVLLQWAKVSSAAVDINTEVSWTTAAFTDANAITATLNQPFYIAVRADNNNPYRAFPQAVSIIDGITSTNFAIQAVAHWQHNGTTFVNSGWWTEDAPFTVPYSDGNGRFGAGTNKFWFGSGDGGANPGFLFGVGAKSATVFKVVPRTVGGPYSVNIFMVNLPPLP